MRLNFQPPMAMSKLYAPMSLLVRRRRRRRRRRYLRSYRTMRAPTHTPTSKHVVTGITEQRCESHEIRTPSRAGICLDLCAARHMHTRTTLVLMSGIENDGDITSPALQSRRVTSSCGCAKRRGLKPRPSPDSSLHPQCGWRVPAVAPVGVATLRCRTRPRYLRHG